MQFFKQADQARALGYRPAQATGRRPRRKLLMAAALVLAVAASAVAAFAPVGAQGTDVCRPGLIVGSGESCTYPGSSVEFSVDSSGQGRFLFFTSGSSINLTDTTINGVVYNFVAQAQSDGSWLIETAGDSVDPTPTPTSTATPTPTPTPTASGICGRTAEVRVGLLRLIEANQGMAIGCADVTDAHLAAITRQLDLSNQRIAALAEGDFDGLTSLRELDLSYNALTTLPAGVFDDLTALRELQLYSNALTALRTGVFDDLTVLRELNLNVNGLTTLPAGVFDNLAALETLVLGNNGLTTLPAGVFDNLTGLRILLLGSNEPDHASRRGVRRADRADGPESEQQHADHASRRRLQRLDRAGESISARQSGGALRPHRGCPAG